ncbi:DNA-binding transcriptional regulator, IclR family [[Clostridium] fimetarium]|uniref:Glycerol operon regulatory protein n=2 Tax=[Clostridium] fimetarium TaxID=99656 RepID=A0A1I0R5W6_9FIRM|nr:DNA-binding transcriptional regulator, IclR family [[Clostridium] fimetarium]
MVKVMEEKVRVVERAFDIIEALACSRKSMSVTDIAKSTKISKSTAFRLLQTMHSRGFVEKDENQAYSIGYKLIDVVSSHINTLELQTEAKSYLEALRAEFNMAVHLGILHGADISYIENLDISLPMNKYTQAGYRSPAYCSSMGKCLLSCLSGEELETLLYNYTFKKYTEYTITNPNEFKQYLKQVRRQGWAMDNQEYCLGQRCVAAPIFDYRSDAIASISISGTTNQITDEKLPEIIGKVKQAADNISHRLGYA